MVVRVLFADQSASVQKLAARAFAQEKIEVIKVGNGDLATWLLDEINPQLVIAEVSLPDTDGYELCRFIKHNPKLSHIPVLLLHWSDETFDYTKADDVRADGYLSKPFESQALINIARGLLEGVSEERKPIAFPHAPTPITADPTESVEPSDTSPVDQAASLDAPSWADDSEWGVPIAFEEPLHAEKSTHASDALSVDEPILEPEANEEAPLVTEPPTDDQEPEAISYFAPYEQAPGISPTGRAAIKQPPIRSPLAWAVLAIIVLSSILGIWQATRIRKTQPATTQNANGSQIANNPQPERQSQATPAQESDAQPAPLNEPTESETYNRNEAAEQRLSSNRGNAARSLIPRPFSLYPWNSFSTNTNQARRATDNTGSNNNKSTDLRAGISTETKPTEINQASASPANNNKLGPSPVRIIQIPAPDSPASGKAVSGSRKDVKPANGFQQIGSGVKSAVVWSGKKAGRALKTVARELKKVFKHDRRID